MTTPLEISDLLQVDLFREYMFDYLLETKQAIAKIAIDAILGTNDRELLLDVIQQLLDEGVQFAPTPEELRNQECPLCYDSNLIIQVCDRCHYGACPTCWRNSIETDSCCPGCRNDLSGVYTDQLGVTVVSKHRQADTTNDDELARQLAENDDL
jgi:hypothetical protein